MRASFVIVNYNRREELLITISKTIELIKNNFTDYEIVLVDNASTDGSAEAIKQHFPAVNLIENKVNTGAPAWNLGFEAAKGNYFIILDDDSHIEEGLEEGLQYMDMNPKVGVLALNVVSGPYTKDNWHWQDGEETIGFIGCGAILRRETYEKIGGYADWMFLYVNEWEYGLRCIDAGYTVQFFENSRVEHRASQIHRSNKRLYVFVQKHEMAIIYKHFGYKRYKYIIRATLNNIKGEIRKRDFRKVWLIILGIKEFFKLAPSLVHTPVSLEAQMQYVKTIHNTKTPVFQFIKDRVTKPFAKLKV